MVKYVTRTVTTTVITYCPVVVENGEAMLGETAKIELVGKVAQNKVESEVRKAFPEIGAFVVTSCEYDESLLGMPIDDFIAHAEPVTRGKAQIEEGENE